MPDQEEKKKPESTRSGVETPRDQLKHDNVSNNTAIEEDEQFRTNDTYGETDSNRVDIQGKIIDNILVRCANPLSSSVYAI
jgi:hypothetical protein